MKKILFLLLCTVSIYGQTSTGQEQSFPYGIVNESLQTITTPTYIGTFGTDGTQGKIPSAYIAKTASVQDSLNKKLNLPTGFLQGLQLSINADPTKFNIAAGYYVVTDFTNLTQPVVKIINYAGATGLTPAYLATSNSTYIALDKNQNVISSASPFTDAQRRTLAIIGNVVHSNRTNINIVNEIKAPIVAVGNQLHDFMKAIGFLNESGNVYSANGANLQINKSVGDIFGMGINASDYLSPHKLTIPAQTALTFAYRFQNGTQLADTQNINPNIYDVGGISTATPSNKWTIQRINLFQSGLSRIQPGQTVYNSFNDAVVSLPTQPFVTEQNIADNAVFRCYLIVQQGTTNLASAVAGGTAQFVPVDKFGNIIGNGSVALTYSNIVAALGFTPENLANKSDSYTASSSTTYASTKALVDGLATKAPISGSSSYIQNQNTSAQSANMWISGNVTANTIKSSVEPGNYIDLYGSTSDMTFNSQYGSPNGGFKFKHSGTTIFSLNADNSATFASSVSAGGNIEIKSGNQLKLYKTDNTDWATISSDPTTTNLNLNGTVKVQNAAGINAIFPSVNNATDLGTSSLAFKNGYFGGNVGIGTTSPSTLLDVNGTISTRVSNGTNVETKALRLTTNGTDNLGSIRSKNTGGNFQDMNFYTTSDGVNENLVLSLKSNGNVGIGTTTDNGIDQLQVNGTISANAATTSNQVVVKSQLDGKVSLTGNETVAGNKTLSGTTTLNETIIREGYNLKFPKGVMYQSSVGTNALTDNRTVSFPDASGTVALVETVRPYKVYTALLSQSGTSAPVATVLENTLGGTIVWTRSGIGSYQATLTGSVYTSSKTVVFATIGLNKNLVINGARVSDSVVSIMAGTGELDSTNMSIEIRVYN